MSKNKRTKAMGKSVFFIVPYPVEKAPSQRFRFEQYFSILLENDIHYRVKSFYSKKTWDILHLEGHFFSKTIRIFASFFIRIKHLFQLWNYDYVFLHREMAPVGPPFFEWIVAKVLRKKMVYDFDDAIWLPNFSEANSFFQKLKYYKKVSKIIKWSYKVSTGNSYLADFARQFNPNVVVNPTTIDTINYHNPELYASRKKGNELVIGWTGTLTTAKYLTFLVPILETLAKEFSFVFHVISNEAPQLGLENLRFIKWNKGTEMEDLLSFDVGVMPLSDDQWAKGKCGFKALQYMALGIPTIASPVGMNSEIVEHGVNGFLCNSAEEWYETLRYFLIDEGNRSKMKEAAIEKIKTHYSVLSNTQNYLSLFS
jgi:glycosyltransferase involved in cell wall biosynthesis